MSMVNVHVCDSTKYLSQIKTIREDIATANRLNCKCTRISRLFSGKCVCVKQDILNNLNKELDNLIAGI